MQISDGAHRYQVLKRIDQIMLLARHAYDYDQRRVYQEAVNLYSVCCNLLNEEITTWDNCCDEYVKEKLITLRTAYYCRMEKIREDLVSSISSGCSVDNAFFDASSFAEIKKSSSISSISTHIERDKLMDQIQRLIHTLKGNPLTNSLVFPEAMFHLQRTRIPMYIEKLFAFQTLSQLTITETTSSSSLLLVEQIYYCLNTLYMECQSKLQFVNPNVKLLYIPSKRRATRSQSTPPILTADENCISSKELLLYRHELMDALKTLGFIPAIELIAKEDRLRTPEEKEDDRRIIDCLVDCKVLIKEVMLPVVLADLHYLLSVYVDCRKQNWSSVLI